MREVLPQTVTPMVSGFGAIDLVRTGVNKATGLKDLCERLNADPEGILAFGDGENDMEMLRYAGWGVAMSNAPEVVRNAADEVIGSNEEQAVLDYLEQLLDRLELRNRDFTKRHTEAFACGAVRAWVNLR